jgi:hypothetical protein
VSGSRPRSGGYTRRRRGRGGPHHRSAPPCRPGLRWPRHPTREATGGRTRA